MIKRLLPILALLLILLIPSRTYASGDIRLTGSSTRIDFPAALTFNIEAESSSPISRIRLLYELDKFTYLPSYAETWLDFTPASTVSASWTWDMRTSQTPPGAKITYWWVIEDKSGNKLVTEKETVSFDDNRYKWQKISSNMVTLYWYKGSNEFAGDLLKTAAEAVDRLGKDTGAPLKDPVNIYIYANSNDLRGSMVATEEWTGGVKYTDYNVISIGISTGNLEWGKKAIAHELGHEVTHQLLTSPYGSSLPVWLDEGIAMHSEGPQGSGTASALIKAIKDGSIASLKSLAGPFPADATETAYAYAQSQSVVEYLLSEHGNVKLMEMLTYLNDGHTIDESLQKVYSFDTEGLDQAWQQYMLSLTTDKLSLNEPAPLVGCIAMLSLRSLCGAV